MNIFSSSLSFFPSLSASMKYKHHKGEFNKYFILQKYQNHLLQIYIIFSFSLFFLDFI